MNAIMGALDAHPPGSTQALNSAINQGGMKDILLNHAGLFEALREPAASWPHPGRHQSRFYPPERQLRSDTGRPNLMFLALPMTIDAALRRAKAYALDCTRGDMAVTRRKIRVRQAMPESVE